MKTSIVALLALSVLSRTASPKTGMVSEPELTGDLDDYSVIGATLSQESSLRVAIATVNPEVLPLRIVFVPHWKYVDDARILRLHVPTGYMSQMFTHLPTKTVYIDTARYQGEEWLRFWIAHELGHLVSGSPSEEAAEKVASKFRKCLKR